MSEMRLYDVDGNRLYLTPNERRAFLIAAKDQRPEVRTFAETLVYSGCRISEALELVCKRVELDEQRLVFRTLKKRRTDAYRAVPVPPDYLDTLNIVHGVREARKTLKHAERRLWSWTREHANREIIKKLMIEAGISEGPYRTPKGLRHAYGVNAIMSGVSLNLLQKWMGHADIKTTAIYANAIGAEETSIAAKMWDDELKGKPGSGSF